MSLCAQLSHDLARVTARYERKMRELVASAVGSGEVQQLKQKQELKVAWAPPHPLCPQCAPGAQGPGDRPALPREHGSRSCSGPSGPPRRSQQVPVQLRGHLPSPAPPRSLTPGGRAGGRAEGFLEPPRWAIPAHGRQGSAACGPDLGEERRPRGQSAPCSWGKTMVFL